MPRKLPRPHERLEISQPCDAPWDSMTGGERVRFCAHCRLHVHNLSEVTPREALELALRSGGRLCLRIERDRSGAPRTRTHAAPLQQIRRRANGLAASAFGAVLTLCSTASAQTPAAGAEPARAESRAADEARPAGGGGASLVGTVLDPAGAVVASARVALRNRETGARFTATTDDGGAYRFGQLPGGTYTLSVESDGFAPFEMSEVRVQEGAGQRVDAALQIPDITVDGGTVVADSVVSTTTAGVVAVVVEPMEPLVKAVLEKDLEAVRKLLLFGEADVDAVDKNLGVTALAEAYSQGNREMVRELLWRGARVNARLSYGQTALMRMSRETTADVVRDLLDAGAKVNLRDEDGNTALMFAAERGRRDVVELLLRAGAKVNARNKDGTTALMNAAIAGAAETVRALLLAGADVSLRDDGGHSALWHARHNDEEAAAALLLAFGAYEDVEQPKQ